MKQDQNVLAAQPQHTSSNYQATAIKAKHLSSENFTLRQTLKDFQAQIQSLRTVNQELAKSSPQSIQIIIDQLSKQNRTLESALFKQLKVNQEMSCDLLMKNQLIVENQNQYRQLISNYQNKIYDLRVNVQSKEAFVSTLEDKIMSERDELYCLPNKGNILSFNEMNELKLLLQRYSIENSQLQLLNIQKGQQLEQLRQKINMCQSLLKKKQEWKTYQQYLSTSIIAEKTKQQENNARINIEQELTRYDNRYKNIRWHNSRKNDLASQVYDFKLAASKLLRDNQSLQQQNRQLKLLLVRKGQQCKLIKEGCKKMNRFMQLMKVENEFYRNNFKELTKVSTQRKIKFYTDHYYEVIPKLQSKLAEKNKLIDYWKNWQWETVQTDESRPPFQQYEQKRMFKKKNKKVKVKLGRSHSCQIKLSHIQKQKKICKNQHKEEAIFSFIEYERHEASSIMGCTFDESKMPSPSKPNHPFFEDQISIISRPSKSTKKIEEEKVDKIIGSPIKKKQKVLENF